MRILTLTWEFPPAITGGLGMACYGIIKELLKNNVEVDLVLPTKEATYFPLRNPDDTDILPACFPDVTDPAKSHARIYAKDLTQLMADFVSVYYTSKLKIANLKSDNPNTFKNLARILFDRRNPMPQISSFTDMAVKIGQGLDFDIIHSHDWLTYPAGMILKKLTGKPLVTHMHATEFDRAGGPGDDRIHKIEYMGMKYSDRVVAVSNYTKDIIADKYCIDKQKIRTVHNAYTAPDQGESHHRIFSEPTVLFMGRITLQKGPDYFLEVARKVLQKNNKVRFIMAGSGDMEHQMIHKAASMGMGTNFLFAGFLDRFQVGKILSTSDLFILPSISEPFGIAPLEAMHKGTIAIISKNSGVAEVIENAFKVDFWDVDKMASIITDLANDSEKLRQISLRGKEEVSNLKWEDAVKKLISVFNELGTTVLC